jgi:chemotaxis protein MotB
MSKKHKGDGHGGEVHADERWLITYADMITLLLAVFIVMYALSDTNLRKFNAFAQSLSSAFNTDVFSGQTAFTVTGGVQTAPETGTKQTGVGFLDSETKAVQAAVEDFATEAGLGADVSITPLEHGFKIEITETVLFLPGRAHLTGDALGMLEQIAGSLRPLDGRLRVVGHTDNTPTSGALYADNYELSYARARAVMAYLVAAGLDESRFSIEGAAEFQPKVANDTAAHREQNRRVDILVLAPTESAAGSGEPTATSIVPSLAPIYEGTTP